MIVATEFSPFIADGLSKIVLIFDLLKGVLKNLVKI